MASGKSIELKAIGLRSRPRRVNVDVNYYAGVKTFKGGTYHHCGGQVQSGTTEVPQVFKTGKRAGQPNGKFDTVPAYGPCPFKSYRLRSVRRHYMRRHDA